MNTAYAPDVTARFSELLSGRYEVQPESSAGRDELIDFLKSAYAGGFNASRYKDEKDIAYNLEWANAKNPNKGGLQSLAWICREKKSAKVVAHFGIIPVVLRCGREDHAAVWGRDLIVLPEFRGQGIGPFLVAGVLKYLEDKAAAFLIAGGNDEVYKIYKNFGFTDMGLIPVYVRANSLGGIVRSRIGAGLFASLISLTGNAAIKIFYAPFGARKISSAPGRETSIEEIGYFDDSFDALRDGASSQPGIAVRRDRAYLNWRFVDQRYWNYSIFKASRKNDDTPAGYVVLREGQREALRMGVVSDIFAFAGDKAVLTLLVDFAISYFGKKDDIALIRCDLLSRDVEMILKRRGFINVPSHSRFMFANIKRGFDAKLMADRDDWFLDYADSDMDLSGA